MKTKPTMRRGFTLVELLVVIVIIAALAALTAPMVIRQRRKADQTEAVNNLHQIGIAMVEFDGEYGSYPDDATATAVATATGKAAITGTDSNDRFKQLYSAGFAPSENVFYCKSAYTQKPNGTQAAEQTDYLSQGECGFGITMKDANTAFASAGFPGRPLCAGPFKAAMDGTFDPDYYDSKAVILKMDNSVASIPISATFSALLNGQDILANTPNVIWGTDTPVWAFPLGK